MVNRKNGYSMGFLAIVLIGLIMAIGLVMLGCDGNGYGGSGGGGNGGGSSSNCPARISCSPSAGTCFQNSCRAHTTSGRERCNC